MLSGVTDRKYVFGRLKEGGVRFDGLVGTKNEDKEGAADGCSDTICA